MKLYLEQAEAVARTRMSATLAWLSPLVGAAAPSHLVAESMCLLRDALSRVMGRAAVALPAQLFLNVTEPLPINKERYLGEPLNALIRA